METAADFRLKALTCHGDREGPLWKWWDPWPSRKVYTQVFLKHQPPIRINNRALNRHLFWGRSPFTAVAEYSWCVLFFFWCISRTWGIWEKSCCCSFVCLVYLGFNVSELFGSVPNVLNVLRGKAATDLFDASPGLDSFSKVQGSTGWHCKKKPAIPQWSNLWLTAVQMLRCFLRKEALVRWNMRMMREIGALWPKPPLMTSWICRATDVCWSCAWSPESPNPKNQRPQRPKQQQRKMFPQDPHLALKMKRMSWERQGLGDGDAVYRDDFLRWMDRWYNYNSS